MALIVAPPPSYDDALKYFTEEFFGTILERVDTDYYTFLFISQGTPHGASHFLIRIDKNGGWKDYSKDFESVSMHGTKTFDNVRIENEKVYFDYNGSYVIDLKTGLMSKS